MAGRPPPTKLLEALSLVASHPMRSEHEQDPAVYFVDFDHLRPLRSDDWQLVRGRRGTGKTLLLRKYHAEAQELAATSSCYVNLQQVALDEGVAEGVQARAAASVLFARLLRTLSGHLLEELDSRYERVLGRNRDRTLSAVLELEALAVWMAADRNDGPSPAVLARARDAVRLAMRGLDVERLILLLDEWSALDPTAETDIQPLFAEHLKATFWAIDGLVVKIAGPPLQVKLAMAQPNGNVIGLEMDQDLQSAVDLDSIYRRGSATEMFRRILNRRLACELPSIERGGVASSITGVLSRTPRSDRDFTSDLFETDESFNELAKAAEYLPRTFLQLLRDLETFWHRNGEADRMNIAFVHQVIRRGSDRKLNELPRESAMMEFLQTDLRRDLGERHCRVFILNRRDTELDALARQLEGFRQIHPTAISVEGDVDQQYRVLQLDYGLWLSWRQDRHDSLPSSWFTATNTLRRDCLQTLQVGLGHRNLAEVRCPTCHAVFRSDSRSFRIRRLCPSCFEPVAADDLSKDI